MKNAIVLLVMLNLFAAASAAQDDERHARDLARFETKWLTANLNGDGRWLERLIEGKHIFELSTAESAKQRGTFTRQLLDVDVPDGAMKVRITGVISFLTNDPAKNRSFNFLDTFNRKGGKWEVIASSFSPAAMDSPAPKELVENEIRSLETEAAKAILEKNETAVARFFTKDSITNDPRGTLTRGYSGVIDAMRSGLINYHSFTRAIESVQVLGDTVIVMGNETVVSKNASGGPSGTVKRRFTNVWMRSGAGWQIVARHANVIHNADK